MSFWYIPWLEFYLSDDLCLADRSWDKLTEVDRSWEWSSDELRMKLWWAENEALMSWEWGSDEPTENEALMSQLWSWWASCEAKKPRCLYTSRCKSTHSEPWGSGLEAYFRSAVMIANGLVVSQEYLKLEPPFGWS